MFLYTFWEPREEIPYYLQLCMETWKKFLPDATIIVLDYKNIGEFLDVRELGLNLFSGKFTLPQIADAIRVALLAKHGGVWLDADTIILNSNAQKYFLPDEKHRTVIFGDLQGDFCQICFINASPAAMSMNLWLQFIRERIWNSKASIKIGWDFFGNAFINAYVKAHPEEFLKIDKFIVMPNKKYQTNFNRSSEPEYIDYYFLKRHHLQDVKNDMLFLQNSWTPQFFKQMSPRDMLNFDCTMTNVLAEVLNITLPPPHMRFRILPTKQGIVVVPSQQP